MTTVNYALNPARIDKFKGEILQHAVAQEVLSRQGRKVAMPKNSSKTYVARRFLPWGASAVSPNIFFANGTSERSLGLANQHLMTDGVTPTPDSLSVQDVSVVMQQYGCLYSYTDQTADMYEDDIPKQLIMQVGERATLVNESICFGTLKASTNQFYGGTGTSRVTVNGQITLSMLRAITRSLQANHGKQVTNMLGATANVSTAAVSAGYFVYCHTDLEGNIRDLPNFLPVERYGEATKAVPFEVGSCERFRFITSPEFVSVQDAGAAVGATGLYSTTGTSIDVYQFIVTAQDAWSQIALRGKDSLNETFLPTGQKSKSDAFGQRGYVGASWYKAVMIENQGWMAVGNVGRTVV
jgi:N4-gp56 family major capsid protein